MTGRISPFLLRGPTRWESGAWGLEELESVAIPVMLPVWWAWLLCMRSSFPRTRYMYLALDDKARLGSHYLPLQCGWMCQSDGSAQRPDQVIAFSLFYHYQVETWASRFEVCLIGHGHVKAGAMTQSSRQMLPSSSSALPATFCAILR